MNNKMGRKYYLINGEKIIILENVKIENKLDVCIQSLQTGETAIIKRDKLKDGGLLDDYFKTVGVE